MLITLCLGTLDRMSRQAVGQKTLGILPSLPPQSQAYWWARAQSPPSLYKRVGGFDCRSYALTCWAISLACFKPCFFKLYDTLP